MKQKEELWENYEDAVFTILMETVAEQEGQKALHLMQELKHDPSAQVPEEVQRKAEKTIRKAFAAQKREPIKHFAFKAVQRIIVAVLVVVATTTCVFAAFPEVRANLNNLLISVYEDHTEFNYTEQRYGEQYSSADFTIEPGWLPDGFVLSDEGQTDSLIYKKYENMNNANFYIKKRVMAGGPLLVDSENTKETKIIIQQYEATLIEKEDWKCLVIPMPKDNKIVYFESNGVSSEDIIRIAENLPL